MTWRVLALFLFNDTATTEIYTLSLHDALPILASGMRHSSPKASPWTSAPIRLTSTSRSSARSEEHTSELQSRQYLVCRLLFEKKEISISCDWTTTHIKPILAKIMYTIVSRPNL